MMKAKKVIFIVMSVLLALMFLLIGIVIGRALDLLEGTQVPNVPTQSTTEPTESQTQPTVPSNTVPPTTEPTVPPTTEPTVPPTTEPPTTVPTEPGHVHEWVLTESVTATCENYGYNIYTCSGCGKQDIPFDEQTKPLGHEFGPGKTVAATCTEEGYTEYTCNNCKKSEKRNVKAALGHDYQLTESIKAGCETAGYDLYACSRCGYEESQNQVEPLGHDYVLTESNCASALYTCSVCGGQKTEGSGVTEHNYIQFRIIKDATCTEDGLRELYCLNCYTYTEEVIPAQHNYTTQTERQEPTCTQDGVRKMMCTRCGDIQTEVLPATGHSYEQTVNQATCTENGVILHKCTAIGCTNEYSEVIPATGHTYGEWKNAAMGGVERSCTTCDALLQTSADLKITGTQATESDNHGRTYMIYVGTEQEPELFVFIIHDNLNNGTLAYSLDPNMGLQVTYTNENADQMGINEGYLSDREVTIPGASTP